MKKAEEMGVEIPKYFKPGGVQPVSYAEQVVCRFSDTLEKIPLVFIDKIYDSGFEAKDALVQTCGGPTA